SLTMVIAEEQTSGRGRSGKAWLSEPGAGLWCSFVLDGPAAPFLPLLMGLAVARAVERAVRRMPHPKLEWPNDITVLDRKVAGVLLESSAGSVLAGVGVNTRAPRNGFPADWAGRAAALDAWTARGPVSRSALATCLVEELRSVLPEAAGSV